MDCSKFVRYSSKKNSYKYLEGIQLKEGYLHKFISFNEFEKKETKIPKDYQKEDVNEFLLKKLKICDNSIKLLEKNNKIYKKIKEKHKDQKSFFINFIYDKLSKPIFLVYISKNKVFIYNLSTKYYVKNSDWSPDNNNNKWMYINLFKTYTYKKIFIGKNHNSKYDGNRLLLNIDKNNYIYIGDNIYKFKTNEEIKDFYSPITNKKIPKPFPISISDKNTYFMIFKSYVPNNKITIKSNNIGKLYDYYYLKKNKQEPLIIHSQKMKGLKIIYKNDSLY
jgi:hypothetical protein